MQKIDSVLEAENPSTTPDIVKTCFSAWLSEGHAKKYSLANYLACIDKVSAYLIRRKLSSVDLWQLTNLDQFKYIYDKAINDKVFRATDKKTYAIFVQVGQAFMKFLKSKPDIYKVPTATLEPPSQPDSRLTIREAIIRVLENELHGMTVEQIYNKIILNGLYSFGAQNPLNVVRVELDRACVNSNYTIRASKNCFRFERDQNGAKVYFPISITPANETSRSNLAVKGELTEPWEGKKEPSDIEIWNDSIERNFKIWMKSENYSASTTRNYCSAINRTIQTFKPLLLVTVSESTMPEAVRKFVSLLNQDSRFISANSTGHNQLSAALTALARFVNSNTSADKATAVISNKIANNTVCTSIIVAVLSAHFPNGFRMDSPIELLRFRRFAAEDFGDEISIDDEDLMNDIVSCGFVFEGKTYIVSTETENRIRSEVDSAISSGAGIIFYGAFYERHENWLFPASVVSEEMLKGMLVKTYPRFMHKTNYFAPNVEGGSELAKIGYDILRVWGEDVLLNYEQLSERLPYIPIEKIKYVLAQNGDFIWNATEVYTHVGKVDITDEESAAIADYIATACRTNGYASISDIPLGDIDERNFELTLTAIHNAVFGIILSDKFDRRGKIITRKGDTLDALTIMKEHCRSLDKCSLQELLDLERELTGETHRWIPMEAGYTIMVRASEDSYIAERYIRFDVDNIDNVLDLFVQGDYLPLKSVTTFAAFPHCGQAWNLFLLESFCRRFSKRYRFEVLAVNSKNAGAIVRKSCLLPYAHILVDAVANSDVPLDKTAIENYLCSNGYLGRRSYAKVDELIEQAKTIRERRD